jgi:DNA-binding phage protein
MLTLEQIIEHLKDRRPGVVAKACGISRQTLHNIIYGHSKPSYETLAALSKYVEERK